METTVPINYGETRIIVTFLKMTAMSTLVIKAVRNISSSAKVYVILSDFKQT
jgi:hypothetical protein